MKEIYYYCGYMNQQSSFICYVYTFKYNGVLYKVSMKNFDLEIFVTEYSNVC